MLEISAKSQNAEIYTATSLKNVSIKDAHPTISKILVTLTGNFSNGVSYSKIIGGRIEQVEALKETLLKTFFWEFSKTFETSFCQHPLKVCDVFFLVSSIFLVFRSNPITLIK